mmetsp:Transcript_51412/g.151543  ORF Transcript_51412/g.151543 Transcript_51412/m.151543 type:complete len:207 (+) Transcript_51412:1220-1840(+)
MHPHAHHAVLRDLHGPGRVEGVRGEVPARRQHPVRAVTPGRERDRLLRAHALRPLPRRGDARHADLRGGVRTARRPGARYADLCLVHLRADGHRAHYPDPLGRGCPRLRAGREAARPREPRDGRAPEPGPVHGDPRHVRGFHPGLRPDDLHGHEEPGGDARRPLGRPGNDRGRVRAPGQRRDEVHDGPDGAVLRSPPPARGPEDLR